MTDLEPGDYLVLAIKKGYKAGFARVTVEAGRTTTQDFKLRPKLDEGDEDEFADLYANYPNPFNPDTWIPYYLPQDADVTIRIYNSAGQLVRTLNFGRKAAGIYVTKEKAAYWDGCDSSGKKVASGVYYYTLQAGDFRATRKMLIVK
ncbi:T9SS type A sorting domain-containing protein [bacterium]|nr:T9SS type A sorting domain-containing protein [bacterium]